MNYMSTFPVALLTLSDSRSEKRGDDVSGSVLRKMVESIGGQIFESKIIADDPKLISEQLMSWADSGSVALILTTGGTGVGPRDNTPEATLDVIERTVPGIVEHMRRETLASTPNAILSRQVAGIRGKCLIINLPGSPKGVEECMDSISHIIPHALDLIYLENTSH